MEKILECIIFNISITVKVHFSAREKIMRIGQNGPLEKFTRFLFMRLNVACITNISPDFSDQDGYRSTYVTRNIYFLSEKGIYKKFFTMKILRSTEILL